MYEDYEEVLKLFTKFGMDASYHFADDSCKEWYLGYSDQTEALNLYNTFPELHEEMRKIANKFLWVLPEN